MGFPSPSHRPQGTCWHLCPCPGADLSLCSQQWDVKGLLIIQKHPITLHSQARWLSFFWSPHSPGSPQCGTGMVTGIDTGCLWGGEAKQCLHLLEEPALDGSFPPVPQNPAPCGDLGMLPGCKQQQSSSGPSWKMPLGLCSWAGQEHTGV